ncbi:MAG: hypothetical protein ACI8RP_000621, partial [Urechidicola sp.]
MKLENQGIINRNSYSEYSGFSPIFNAGYHYTFVLHKHWYTNVYVNPGVGIDFYKKSFLIITHTLAVAIRHYFSHLRLGFHLDIMENTCIFGETI